MDNHQYHSNTNSVECLLAAGVVDSIKLNAGDALNALQDFISTGNRWLFGHLGYDLKNEIEDLGSSHVDLIQFPDLYFFQPQVVIKLDEKRISINSQNEDEEEILDQILSVADSADVMSSPVAIRSRIAREEYISIIQKLREHILRGDCYEINFCQEFFSENAIINPLATYKRLCAVSPNPFSAFYRLDEKYLLCASPERYLKKSGSLILSQPIKGTSKRMTDPVADEESRDDLKSSSKDRSENVMIVDLVRNDLSKICVEGTVKVDELFAVYSFPQVHQMISTVSGHLRDNISFSEIVKSTFPMGSMSGAPKRKVLELIEQYESTKRGIFSGALGYIQPGGDFDFNVVIRSIMYNEGNRYLSFQAGSGITFYSEAASEWQECMVKVAAMKQVLVG